MIEYMPWYQAGSALMRCAGDDGCGALLVEGDMQVHTKWHERIQRLEYLTQHPPKRPVSVPLTRTKGAW